MLVLVFSSCCLCVGKESQPTGKNKLKDQWEDIPYLVSEYAGDLPVYLVQQGGSGSAHHCNLLLPCHVPHEKLQTPVATDTDPRQGVQSLGLPGTECLANDASDEELGELEPIAIVTTETSILEPGVSPLLPGVEHHQNPNGPPTEDIPISLQETILPTVAAPTPLDHELDPPEDVSQ